MHEKGTTIRPLSTQSTTGVIIIEPQIVLQLLMKSAVKTVTMVVTLVDGQFNSSSQGCTYKVIIGPIIMNFSVVTVLCNITST